MNLVTCITTPFIVVSGECPQRDIPSCSTQMLGVFDADAVVNCLTHWGPDEMAAILQTMFPNAFSWMKICEFSLRFHWSLFLRV